MESEVDADIFQDSFDVDMAQMPGDRTMMLMNAFSMNSLTDSEMPGDRTMMLMNDFSMNSLTESENLKSLGSKGGSTSPGFVSAKHIYAEVLEEQSRPRAASGRLGVSESAAGNSAPTSGRSQAQPMNSRTKICQVKREQSESSPRPRIDLSNRELGMGSEYKYQNISQLQNEFTKGENKERMEEGKRKREISEAKTDVNNKKDKNNEWPAEGKSKMSKKNENVGCKSEDVKKSREEKDVNKSTEEEDVKKSTEEEDIKKSIEEEDVKKSNEEENVKKFTEEEDVKKFTEEEDVKKYTEEEDPACELSRWGLPESILALYKEKGIQRMFPWQVECLRSRGVMDGRNLVYSAPTSAGKTLVAEILMIKRVIETGRKALLILPFVSLAREKMFHLQYILGDTGVRVEGFMGSISPAGGIKVADIAIATIEKANGIVNRLLEGGELDTISCVVVDELHLLGDSSRGYLLELLLTKIRYVSLGFEDPEKSVQIIGMSATLPNLTDLSDWLDASLYTTSFRPVPLTELVKIGTTLLNTSLHPVGNVLPAVNIPNDTEHISWLSLETVLAGHSILIFCPIKSWVEKLAESIAKDFFLVGKPDSEDMNPESCSIRSRLQKELDGFKLGEVLEQLVRCPSGLDSTLAATVRFGVGFHHAGLTTDERDILEGNFKSGVIRVLVATSTLSSGVNLPARRVILRCPMTFNGQLMERLAYKQMVGRAGRKGVDSAGESILICKDSEREKVRQLVSGETEPVLSCLAAGGNRLAASMKRAILEVIVSGAASTREQVERYAGCTLLAAQLKKNTGEQNTILECVHFLEKNEFIRFQGTEVQGTKVQGTKVQGTTVQCTEGDHKAPAPAQATQRYVATRLGLACLASSLAPDEGLTVFAELNKARRQFVLENELHIIYLIVPIYAAVSWPKLDWMAFLSMWEGLSEDMRRVGHIVGVEERWIVRAMRGTIRSTDAAQRAALATHQRFYTALALHDLAHEVPLSTVASKYGATKGMLQSLQQAASTFAGMVTVFCARLGWNNLELLLGQFQDRLEFGVRRELVDLCRLTSVDGARARVLHDGGIETVAQLAASDPGDVENILYTAQPFQKKKDGENIRTVKTVFISGRAPMTEGEAARIMVAEARSVLTRDLGLQPGAWLQNQGGFNPPGPPVLSLSSAGKKGSSAGRGRHSSSGSSNVRKRRRTTSSEKTNSVVGCSSEELGQSPHLKYHLDTTKPTNLTESWTRKLVSPRLGSASKKRRLSTSPKLASTSTPSIIGNREIFISPPEKQRIKVAEQSPGGSKTSSVRGQNPEISKTRPVGSQSPERSKTRPVGGQSPDKTKTRPVGGQSPEKTKTRPVGGQSPDKTKTRPVIAESPERMKTRPVWAHSPDKTKVKVIAESPERSKTRPVGGQSPDNTKTRPVGGQSPEKTKTRPVGYRSPDRMKTRPVGGQSPDKTKTRPVGAHSPELDNLDEENANPHQFDMSSILENIFGDEMEITAEKKKRKKVSWGETNLVFLAEEDSKSPEPGQAVSMGGENSSFNQSPSGYVHIEDLSLELSDSQSDGPSPGPPLENLRPVSTEPGRELAPVLQAQRVSLGYPGVGENTLRGWEDDMFDTSMEPPKSKRTEREEGSGREEHIVVSSGREEGSKTEEQIAGFSARKRGEGSKTEDEIAGFSVRKRGEGSEMEDQISEYSAVNRVGGSRMVDQTSPAKMLSPFVLLTENWETGFSFSPSQSGNMRRSTNLPVVSESPQIRSKISLKERKKKAKLLKKDFRSPGDLIMSDSGSDEEIEPNQIKENDKETQNQKNTRHNKNQKIAQDNKNQENAEQDQNKDDILRVQSKDYIKCIPNNSKENATPLRTPVELTKLPGELNSLTVIDICSDSRIFQSFISEIKSVQSLSFAVAVERDREEVETKLTRGRAKDAREVCRVDTGVVVGVAFCFSGLQSFYLSLLENQTDKDPNDTLKSPAVDHNISLEEKMEFLRWLAGSRVRKTALSWRRQSSLLYRLTGALLQGPARDPAVASWLLDPGSPPSTLNRMVLEHLPHLVDLIQYLGSAPGVGSLSCSASSPLPGRLRALAESVLVFHLQDNLDVRLAEGNMAEHYTQVEMKVDRVLLGMELSGMGVHTGEFRDTRLMLEQRTRNIEEEAYRLAGRHFTFSSPQDICRVLYHEMKYPVNGDPKLHLQQVRPGKAGIRLSAAKEALEKLARSHQLPKLILEHRRISGALSRTVNPLLSVCVQLPNQIYPRVFPTCITHTATGRISLQEPNLQNIPKDFEVDLTEDLRQSALGRRSGRRGSTNRSVLPEHLEKLLEPSHPSSTVSLRNALVPGKGNLFLSADYSQVELRILAHLSQDALLLDTLTAGGDVFKSLASRTNKVEVSEVTEAQRQQAKQVVYGLIYGIGAKSLADQLQVSEAEADKFMEKFKAKYPGVRIFLNKCVATARRTGVVETISGRQRSIPDISSTNMHRRAAAERQAVNTKVQGSAADLVKTAMVRVDRALEERWPNRKPVKWSRCTGDGETEGAWLVLHIHDELIYEVSPEAVLEVACLVRDCMETAVSLSVPTPVRLKVGETWGSLKVFLSP